MIEKTRVEKRDREWSAQALSRAGNITRLRQEPSALEATLKEMQSRETQKHAQENNDKGLFGYLSSFWSATPAKTEEEKRKEKLEQIQQNSTTIRLQRAKTQLQQAEEDHWSRVREQNRIKSEESLREHRARAQREQEVRDRRAREQDEAARAREAGFKRAQDKARQRQQSEECRRRERQDDERRERDLRQDLLDRLAKHNTQHTQAGHNQGRFTSSAAPKTANRNTFPGNRRPAPRTPSSSGQRDVCRHKKFWPKVNGRHECSICLKTFHSFVLQCPNCNIMACAPRKKSLRGP